MLLMQLVVQCANELMNKVSVFCSAVTAIFNKVSVGSCEVSNKTVTEEHCRHYCQGKYQCWLIFNVMHFIFLWFHIFHHHIL